MDPSARAFEKSVRSAERGRRGGQAGAGALGQAGASGPQNLSLFPLFASFRLFPSPLSLSLSLSTFLAPYSLFPSQISVQVKNQECSFMYCMCELHPVTPPLQWPQKRERAHHTPQKRESSSYSPHKYKIEIDLKIGNCRAPQAPPPFTASGRGVGGRMQRPRVRPRFFLLCCV